MKRYLKNNNEYKKYLILIGKYKSVPDQLMLKNLSDILIKSNDLDELDFLIIIIRNPF